jgi:hypothetical protein
MTDWNKVSEASAAILVAAKSVGFSSTYDPTRKCIYDLRKIAKEFGLKLIEAKS